MESTNINVVTLSKTAYDNMRSTNDKAGMLLNGIINTMTIADDSDELSLDSESILTMIQILYPSTFKKKVSALKTVRTKNLTKFSK